MQEKMTRTQHQRSEATLSVLQAAARQLFVQQGYRDTGTPDIVRAAALTRGALYHHFEDKAALFFAVAQQMAQEVALAIEAQTSHCDLPMQALLVGANAYLQAMAEQGRAKLLLLEAPTVLNAQQLQWLSDMAGAQALHQGLSALLTAPDKALCVPAQELHALTDLLSASFDRTALALARGEDVAPHQSVLRKLLLGLETVYGRERAGLASS